MTAMRVIEVTRFGGPVIPVPDEADLSDAAALPHDGVGQTFPLARAANAHAATEARATIGKTPLTVS